MSVARNGKPQWQQTPRDRPAKTLIVVGVATVLAIILSKKRPDVPGLRPNPVDLKELHRTSPYELMRQRMPYRAANEELQRHDS